MRDRTVAGETGGMCVEAGVRSDTVPAAVHPSGRVELSERTGCAGRCVAEVALCKGVACCEDGVALVVVVAASHHTSGCLPAVAADCRADNSTPAPQLHAHLCQPLQSRLPPS